MLRSPQELKIIGAPAQMKFVLCRYAPPAPRSPFFYRPLSVRQKKKILRSKDKDVRFTEIIVRGANRDKNSLLGKNKILYFVKEEERFLFYTNGKESHSNRIMRICIRFVLSI